MKTNRLASLILAFTVLISCLAFPMNSRAADGYIEISSKNFPDATFREILSSTFDKDDSNTLSEEERKNMQLELRGVSDLTGISLLKDDIYFLKIYGCDIKKIDFDFTFKDLDIFFIANCNELTEIGKISTPTKLALAITNCEKLTEFNAYDTQYHHLEFTCRNLKTIDLSNVTCLQGLFIYNGASLESLDISNCKDSIGDLFIYQGTSLKTLDVSSCPNLGTLLLGGSLLEKLDVSNCPNLKEFQSTSDKLTELDLTSTYYLNYCVLNGTKDEYDYADDVSVYQLGNKVNYSCVVHNNTKLITVDVDAGVKISDIVEDPVLAERVARKCDDDKNGLISEPERNSLTELSAIYGHTITTVKDLNYFTNLETFEGNYAIFDTIDLQYLPCKNLKLIGVQAKEIIFPDNTKVVNLDLRNSYFGSDKLYLGHQEDLRYINYDHHSLLVTPEKLIKVLDVSDCPYMVENCLGCIRMIYSNNDGSKSIEYRKKGTGDIFIEVNGDTRIKFGKDIMVSASHGTVTGGGEDLTIGSEAYLQQKPDEGYVFKGWYEAGKLVSEESNLRVQVTRDRRFVAKYEPDPGYVSPTATPTLKVTATPKVTAKPTTKPTTKPKPTSAPAGDPKEEIFEFVERIYIYVLDREPEADGAAFWSNELWNFNRTGAEVAQGFIFSPEFEARGTSDKEFVTILYKTFFGRDPEEEGMNYWLNQLSSGTMDRVTVANGFIYSQEWADTCAEYGIRSGGDLKPSGLIAPTDLTYGFVERLYTTAMGRDYDEEGRQYWASELANFNMTGEQAGASFFLSDEMNGFGLSDKEFLVRLYATFMDREPDGDGSAYWLGVMASGTTRADVVFGFTRSPEFTDKCVEARILPY